MSALLPADAAVVARYLSSLVLAMSLVATTLSGIRHWGEGNQYDGGGTVGIHSKFLIHWTGNDIETKCRLECLSEADKSQLYVERLNDDLSRGLFARRTTEALIRKRKIKRLVRICFTEIRLSQARTHAQRYGKLGLGFTREFIMSKGGRPVIYVPYQAECGGCLLEESIWKVYEESRGNPEIHRSAKWIMAHVKRMGNGNGENADCYYEEMEWRLVYGENPDTGHFVKGEAKGVFRLRPIAGDIRLIIFPDDSTRQLALDDNAVKEHFSGHMPIMATLDDCSDF